MEPQTKTLTGNQAPETSNLSNYLQQINNKFRPEEYNKLQEAADRKKKGFEKRIKTNAEKQAVLEEERKKETH
jgi:hypothetical protein